jgi:uncharacterized protein
VSVRIERFETVARERARGAGPAHDYLHVERVARVAKELATQEGARVDVAVTAALLHELWNYPKDHPDSARSGDVCASHAREVMEAEACPAAFIGEVTYAISVHSFSKGVVPETLEAKILQDADRLDAIGAIGIARAFATCSEMRRPFYSPADPFCEARTPDDKLWGIDHFYKKLLTIPETLHTSGAKKVALTRVAFLRTFLAQLGKEIPV